MLRTLKCEIDDDDDESERESKRENIFENKTEACASLKRDLFSIHHLDL